MSERVRVLINLTALQHNFAKVKVFAPSCSILAMIKSNAYGHGSVKIAQHLQQADSFGVACYDEAMNLRESGIHQPIVLMSGFFHFSELDTIAKRDLQIVVHNLDQLHQLETSNLSKPITVWLKIDTGMHRLGIAPHEVNAIYARLAACKNVARPIHLMTHLADAFLLDKPSTMQQIHLFNEVTHPFPGPKSIANSAGIIAWPDSHKEWVRPGIMLYGVSPMLDKIGSDHGLKPVMTVVSKLIAIHEFQKGDAIGYGGIFKCPQPMRVGVVAIGYGDGYPRHAKSGTPTLINGKICPLVGRVSMDMITVDLEACLNARVGDEVILWGEGLPVESIAEFSDTIGYEPLCHVSQRAKIVYV